MLVYLHVPNLIFLNVFGIRSNYSFNMQHIMKIHLLGFPIITFVGNFFWKFLGVFLVVPFFQNMIEWMLCTRGYTPYFILGSNKYFFYL